MINPARRSSIVDQSLSAESADRADFKDCIFVI